MNPLLAAIESKWQEATAITASGPWFGVASDTATYPCGVITNAADTKKERFFGGSIDSALLRFTVFDDDFADVGTIQTALHARFPDTLKLTLSSGHNFHCVLESYSRRYECVDKNGVKIYRADSMYRFRTA